MRRQPLPRSAGPRPARILLVHSHPLDADELLALFRDRDVRRYLLDDIVVGAEWLADEIAASQARFDETGAGLWAVGLVDRAAIIGFAGFREFYEPPQLQLLYGLLPAYWGQGLATEAAARACDHAFRELGFREVRAATDAPNRRSAAVLQRLGMRHVRRSDDGAGTDFYAVTRDEWLAYRSARR